ncbi:MAG: electron transport complex subunit RsxA [Clostridia bacterium]|nr:electron transport complex subunit RsxA [Clostridia bacterium]
MNIFASIMAILVSAALSNNFVFAQTYGICPFLGVSKKTSSAAGMGAAVTIVMVIATMITYPIYMALVALNIQFLEILIFIFVIAALVQMIEKIIKKISPPLYNAMGIYLPLITTNCAVLAVCEITANALVSGTWEPAFIAGVEMNFGFSVLYALFAGIGFTLAMVIMSGIREKLNNLSLPKAMQGFPITMITASFIAMAFYVFTMINVGGGA